MVHTAAASFDSATGHPAGPSRRGQTASFSARMILVNPLAREVQYRGHAGSAVFDVCRNLAATSQILDKIDGPCSAPTRVPEPPVDSDDIQLAADHGAVGFAPTVRKHTRT